jgi:hypothetical protein
MIIGKHIATSIFEYLNEQNNTENGLNDNFWKWFGNSKVVYNNKPFPVYHGSPDEFDEFMYESFFTEDYFNADGYAREDGIVYEVYLSIKNPLILDCKDKKWDDIDTPYGTSTTEVVSNADRSKYDGIIFINIKDAWFDDAEYQDSSTIYATFSPNQIKSIENDGSWDIDDNNIYS